MDKKYTKLNKKYFKSEAEKFSKLAKYYEDKCVSMYEEALETVVRKEYSVGGWLSRGYYCPSPIRDIVIGNSTRGRLIKRLTKRSKPEYEFGFDSANRLVTVYIPSYEKCLSNKCEVIVYNKNSTIGITFRRCEKAEIHEIAECLYDENNRIVSYTVATLEENSVDLIDKEIYEYDDKGLCYGAMYDFTVYHSYSRRPNELFRCYLNFSEFKFFHDDEGYLKEYIADRNRIYKVYLKRKV